MASIRIRSIVNTKHEESIELIIQLFVAQRLGWTKSMQQHKKQRFFNVLFSFDCRKQKYGMSSHRSTYFCCSSRIILVLRIRNIFTISWYSFQINNLVSIFSVRRRATAAIFCDGEATARARRIEKNK